MLNEIEYLYVCLAEELSEASKCATKILRFGKDSQYSEVPTEAPKTNLERLRNEVTDIIATIELLEDRGQQVKKHGFSLKFAIEAKKHKLKVAMEQSKLAGCLEAGVTNQMPPPPPAPPTICGPSPSA